MIVIAPSEIEPNKYFIFRSDGIEVAFYIMNNKIESDCKLTKEESIFLKRFYLKKETPKSDIEQIMELRNQNHTYSFIAEKFNISVGGIFNIIESEISA